jgi:thioredoxin
MKHTILFLLVLLGGITPTTTARPTNLPKDPNKPIHLTKADFLKKVMDYEKHPKEWVYKGDKPAIIDFYADWCAPCRKAAPALDELAKEYSGKVYIYKINIDKERELASVFGVRNIPAFLIIPMEGRPQMANGAAPTAAANKQRFKQIIDDVLLKKNKTKKQ